MNEKSIEQEIQEKGLTAFRITPEHIDSVIVKDEYYLFSGSQMTICCLTLDNGFNVIGESACVNPENFDIDIGKKIAYEAAKNKIWQLEGYLLKQNNYVSSITVSEND